MAAKDTSGQTYSDGEWETFSKPRYKLTFNEIGDVVSGTWVGFEEIVRPDTGEVMMYANFDNMIEPEPVKGQDAQLSASYQLTRDLEKIPEGSIVRLTWVSETPVRQGNPLKNFLVQVRR